MRSKLKGDGDRIGVIVLATSDNWTSWAEVDFR